MAGGSPAPITVSGGADGIDAHCDDIVALARLFGQAATDTAGTALVLHGYLADVGVGLSSVFDPMGTAEFEAALVLALDGPGGATPLALRCAATDASLRAAAAAYETADRLDTYLSTRVDAVLDLPSALASGASTFARTGNPRAAGSAAITADPALLDVAVDRLGGPRGPLALGLDGLLADGHADVRANGPDTGADEAGPPRSFADVVAGLARRNTGLPGEIDVRKLTDGRGRVSYIVDIPGTKSWSVGRTSDVTSATTDLLAATGSPTSYERGVLAAMAAAGIRKTDPVMLVGHSEGGMVAANAATRAVRSGRFNVTNVITAGSPIAATAGSVPDRVQVLAIENAHDVVPHADGAENPPAANVTTVTVHHDHHDVLTNHDLDTSYIPGAADIDRSNDTSVAAYRASAEPFLSAASVMTTSFVISRRY